MSETASAALRRLASADPDRPALVTRDGTTTYDELDRTVDRLAGWLRARDTVRRGDVVALRFLRTDALITSSLALARAGLAVALIDPTAPPERVRVLLADLTTGRAAPLLLTDLDGDPDAHNAVPLAEALGSDVAGPPPPPEAELAADDLQHVIYTSGSTGAPTGLRVDGTQQSAIDGWIRTLDGFKDAARVGVVAAGTLGQAASFPLTVVGVGGTMVVHEVLLDGLDGIPAWLRDQRVEGIGLVPTLIRFLLPALDAELGPDGVLPDLSTVAVWGESSGWEEITRLRRHLPATATVANAYATTETGLVSMLVSTARPAADTPPSGAVPAGVALPGVTIDVMDPEGRSVPVGAAGEIVVTSGHLARGHWRRPDLDARIFVTGPGGTRSCRTGDEGHLDADGTLHVHGRLDDVVKIAGHRVALGELEQAAMARPEVAAAAASARTGPSGDLRLHLYVVAAPGRHAEPRWLRAALARTLPPYALPDTIDQLTELPVLGTGKADRAALPEPRTTRTATESADAAPRVSALAALFAEVLERDSVGPEDDFFELGGDSLRAGRLVAALQTRWGCYVPTSLVIEAPTPAALAAAVETTEVDPILLAVDTSGDGSPLIVVHGGGGEVSFARGLASHLEPKRPVYALQPPRLVGPRPFAPTLQAMAERYLTEVRRVSPEGPYRLYGYSMGGLVAFEMATLLQDAGEEVELLALGDTHSPETLLDAWATPTAAAERAREARPMRTKIADEVASRRAQVRRRMAREPRRAGQWEWFQQGGEPAPEIRNDAYASVYARLAFEHGTVRTPFHGDVVLVRAARDGGPADRGWRPHVTGRVQVVDLDATHGDLVTEPGLGDVARVLGTPALV